MIDATGRLLALTLVAAGGAIAVLASGAPDRPVAPASARFQRAVGGLGTGPAIHPARCGRAFDGRVTPFCSWRHGAVPGADRSCPLHGPPVRVR